MTNDEDRLLQEAWERYRSAPSDESLAEFNRLWEPAMQRAEQQDLLIAAHDIWKVIPSLAGPALRRLREKPPTGFPHPVKTTAGVSYYSAKKLKSWDELRIAQAIRIIEPDLQVPPSLSPQARIYRNGIWKTPEAPREICEAIIEEAIMAMAQEVEIFFEETRMDSVDQRKKVEQLRAAMTEAKLALEDLDMPRQLQRELAFRDAITPEAVARVIGRCDERPKKPKRRPAPDAFEKEIAAKWARELLKRFGCEEKIVCTKRGPCDKLAAVLYGPTI